MEALYWIGGAVCHQLPDRTVLLDGTLLPFCARCTGIYLGFVLSVGYFYVQKRYFGNKLLKGIQIFIAAFCFLPFMLDGMGSYIGIWQSNNLARILTGLPAGVSLPYFFILIKNFNIDEENNLPVYKSTKEQIALLLSGFTAVLLIYENKLPFLITAALSVIGEIAFIGMVIGLIIQAATGNRLSFKIRLWLQCLIMLIWILGIAGLHSYLYSAL